MQVKIQCEQESAGQLLIAPAGKYRLLIGKTSLPLASLRCLLKS